MNPLHRAAPFCAAIAILLLAPAARGWLVGVPQLEAARAPATLSPGDYAGWAYFSDGGDFPLRWSCREERGERVVTVSLPHQRAQDLAAECSATADGETTVVLEGSSGLSFTGMPSEVGILGTLRWGTGRTGTFELARAEVPLPFVPVETYSAAAGPYRSASGDSLVITTWPWGELRCLDLATGEDRTLYAAGDDGFVAGSALGLPAPTRARFQLFRGGDGRVEALELRRVPDGEPIEYERLALRQEEIDFESGSATLRGTLLRPDTDAKVPAIVILGGSDVTVRQHVQATAQIYASFGLAAFAYDLRGYGQSGGERDCALAQSADDAGAAVQMLARRDDIDSAHVGIAGTSRGGWTAPLAASRCEAVSFLVLFVAPALSPQRQLTSCWLDRFRAAGHSEEESKEAADYVEHIWRCAESDENWASYEEVRREVRERGWLAQLGGPESRDAEDYHWLRLNARYDPLPALERTRCAVLALYGEHDLVVSPRENEPLLRAALERAGNRDATIRVLPGVDHGLWRVDPQSPTQSLPLHRAQGFGSDVWSTVRYWLAKRTRD